MYLRNIEGAYCEKYRDNRTGLIEIQASSNLFTIATAQRWAHRSVVILRSFWVIAPPNFYFFLN